MKLSSNWIRDFVDLSVDDHRLAEGLTAVGIATEGISGSGADTVFEMEIGTNRPDAMNHYGVAREAAAIYEVPLKAIEPKLPSAKSDAPFPITIEEPALCPRFTARVIRGTHIKPSPETIAHRLQLLDQRPISNAVDATNYVLWEIGKPTHVYDHDLLEGGTLIVRMARNGEKLKTLDGVERILTSEDLVVADGKKAVGLAGVMGGFDTMITEKTKNIVIESAWWDPVTVRKMSRRHGLHTDASHRFERGADFESTVLSCDRVAELILQSGGGKLQGDPVDVVARKMDQALIVLRVAEVWRILGSKLKEADMLRILKKLGFECVPSGLTGGQFDVRVPSWRLDVEREIDLIEEIARLHGYDKFENTLPAYSGAVVDLPHAAAEATVRKRALALGYNEAISLTFISHMDAEKFSASAAGAKVLELENPQSDEASVMRTSLAPGMLDRLAWNLNRDAENVRLFEMAQVYMSVDGQRTEPKRACLGATLAAVKRSLPVGEILDVSASESKGEAAEAFRAFKGDVENLLAPFAGKNLSFDRQTAEYFHPGRSARALLDGAPVAQFGQIHPDVVTARRLRQDVFLAELDLESLYERGLREPLYTPLPKYPAVERDFSFIFADGLSFEEMRRSVAAAQLNELREFKPVEMFRSKSIGAGKYSILLRAKFQSGERTLREEEVAQWSARITAALLAVGGTQRA
ncbi:MAG TPA: phenylalanine--tRNA ligase subunit beta [Candidatus Sulfotelmatobacter sp.]